MPAQSSTPLLLAPCALAIGCVAREPELAALVEDTPIAVVATPAEAPPGGAVTLDVLVAGPDGRAASPPLRYAFCTSRRPPGENGAVSQRCAGGFESAPQAVQGTRFSVTVPANACKVFGPEVPAGTRPEDADATGGYYQPLRIALGSFIVIHRQRIRCALSNTPLEDTQTYARSYVDNRAPGIARLTLSVDGAELEVATDAAERYLRFDPARGGLTESRERLSVRWWSAGGPLSQAFSAVHDGRAEVHFPGERPSAVWAVLSDDRGGVAVLGSDDDEARE